MVMLVLLLVGLSLGSFVNAWLWRLHAQEDLRARILRLGKKPANQKKIQTLKLKLRELSIANGRSKCLQCGHELAPHELIPVASWLWLRGKCRYCGASIPDTPVAELLVPALFAVSYWWWPLPLHGYGLLSFLIWLACVVAFVLLTLYDIRWFLLPDKIVWPLVVLVTAQVIVHATLFHGGWTVWWTAGWGVIIASGIFYVLYVVSKGRWIGGGDVKLGLVLGLLVGGPMPALLLLFAASMLGTLVSVPLLLSKKVARNSMIPFGPFLLATTVVVVLFGEQLIAWYARLLLV